MPVVRFDRTIHIPLFEPMTSLMLGSGDVDPSRTVPIKRRIFEYRHRLEKNLAEYREVETLNG